MGSHVKFEEKYIQSTNGEKLFTCRWVPSRDEPKALVFLCHGYAMESSISMQGMGTRLAKAGYGVYGIDYIGHGKSGGQPGYIPSFDNLVQDCVDHFSQVCEEDGNKGKVRILIGESMGGAVALLMHRKMPDFWDGAVLIAPMCKIAEDMTPNPIVIKILSMLAYLVPTWKLVPNKDIIEAAVRDPERKKEVASPGAWSCPLRCRSPLVVAAKGDPIGFCFGFSFWVRSNPYWYTGGMRLKTAKELLNASIDIEKRLNEVTLPFLVIHGGDDKVTDPAISKLLYEDAVSTDKTFKLYDGMWHALTYGELPENIDIVFNDIIGWLDKRSRGDNYRLERERKNIEDKDAKTFDKPLSRKNSV